MLEPEKAHAIALSALNFLPAMFRTKIVSQPLTAMGLEFSHRVGLAAGLDKNAEYLDALAKLGFAFIEVGTVTPRPQLGHPKPRLFRLTQAHALINRMGFNNHGVDALIKNIKQSHYSGILGINIGKNKATSLNLAAEDYLYCLRKVYSYATYVVINVSSPNTPELRKLQQDDYFRALIKTLKNEQLRLAEQYQKYVPLVVKISPDESQETLKNIASEVLKASLEGLIATNTTCQRDELSSCKDVHVDEEGGLSGRPLFKASTECLRVLKSIVGQDVTLIGVGGIEDTDTAQAKLEAGATLLQVYSGLIYRGPKLIQEIARC